MSNSLFARSAGIFFSLLLVFQFTMLLVSSRLIFLPLITHAAEDFARLIGSAVDRYQQAGLADKFQVAQALHAEFKVDISTDPLPRDLEPSQLPYIQQLQTTLTTIYQQPIEVQWSPHLWKYIARLPMQHGVLTIRFSHERIGTQPWATFGLMVLLSITLSTLAAVWVARYVTRPLQRLQRGADQLGAGANFQPITESGPREVIALAHRFNRLGTEIHQLMQNRTYLLAGISHDLRTPLARIRLALEIVRTDPTPLLFDRLERYLDDMNKLIDSFVEFSRGVTVEQSEPCDLGMLLEEIVTNARSGGADIHYLGIQHVMVTLPSLSVSRIVNNLVDNALRYGHGQPVEVELTQHPSLIALKIHDRGPGIPANQRQAVFQPFVRLEQSRNTTTGGSGLGLAMAKQIADRHGWQLSLQARDAGGTTAVLEISLL
ncbi:MAG: HAMP domain-containing protein [Gammaproteobacteria bacterium]|nr:HAMP domain-containing protein [Gammaproteobacteria bacterium]